MVVKVDVAVPLWVLDTLLAQPTETSRMAGGRREEGGGHWGVTWGCWVEILATREEVAKSVNHCEYQRVSQWVVLEGYPTLQGASSICPSECGHFKGR